MMKPIHFKHNKIAYKNHNKSETYYNNTCTSFADEPTICHRDKVG